MESVIQRNPKHPGALHLYIHLMEPTGAREGRGRGRRPAAADARGRAPRAHALAHLPAGGPLRGRGEDQPGRGPLRRGLHHPVPGAGLLPHGLLPAQRPLHLVRGHHGRPRPARDRFRAQGGGQGDGRGPEGAAAARGLPRGALLRPGPLRPLGRDAGGARPSCGQPLHGGHLALRPRAGVPGQGPAAGRRGGTGRAAAGRRRQEAGVPALLAQPRVLDHGRGPRGAGGRAGRDAQGLGNRDRPSRAGGASGGRPRLHRALGVALPAAPRPGGGAAGGRVAPARRRPSTGRTSGATPRTAGRSSASPAPSKRRAERTRRRSSAPASRRPGRGPTSSSPPPASWSRPKGTTSPRDQPEEEAPTPSQGASPEPWAVRALRYSFPIKPVGSPDSPLAPASLGRESCACLSQSRPGRAAGGYRP